MDHAPSTSGRGLAWQCQACRQECTVIGSESRCLCGHRYKDHRANNYGCSASKCHCSKFFYIFAEGSFILRCRCKHKHVEHDPETHACTKAACSCQGFNSPWVCNCDHPWSQHRQMEVQMQQGRAATSILAAVREITTGTC